MSRRTRRKNSRNRYGICGEGIQFGDVLFRCGDADAFTEPNYAEVMRFHDVSAIMFIIHPEFFKGTDYYVEMSTEGITSGATVADLHGTSGKQPNVHVLHDVDRETFVKVFIKAVLTISNCIS